MVRLAGLRSRSKVVLAGLRSRSKVVGGYRVSQADGGELSLLERVVLGVKVCRKGLILG